MFLAALLAFLPACALERSGSNLRIEVNDSEGRSVRVGGGMRGATLFDGSGRPLSAISLKDASDVACFYISVVAPDISSTYPAGSIPELASSCTVVSGMKQVSSLVSGATLQQGVDVALTMGVREIVLYAVNLSGYDSNKGCPVTTLDKAFALDPNLMIYKYASTKANIERGMSQLSLSLVPEESLAGEIPSSCYDKTLVAPSAFKATVVSSSSIRLDWSDNSNNETGFIVERSPNGVAWTTIGTTAANVTTYLDSGLSSLTSYYYRLTVFNDAASERASNIEQATTAGNVPAQITGLAVTSATESSISLAWSTPPANATSVEVWWAESADPSPVFTQLTVLSGSAVSHPVSTIAYDRPYQFKVVAVNADGAGAFSSSVLQWTKPSMPTLTAVSATSPTNVRVSWTSNNSNLTGYKVIYTDEGGTTTPIPVSSAAVHHDVTVSDGQMHTFKLVATNLGGDSVETSPLSTATQLLAPTNPGSSVAAGPQINVTWTDRGTVRTKYVIHRSVNGGAFAFHTEVTTNFGTYQDTTSLIPTLVYAYKIWAAKPGSMDSDPIQTSPLRLTVPNPPTNFVVSARTDTSLTVKWTDNSTQNDFYTISRGTVLGTYGNPVDPGVDREVPIMGLEEGTQYFFKLDMTSDTGSATALTDGITQLAKPASVTAEPVTGSGDLMKVSFVDKSTKEESYLIEYQKKGEVDWKSTTSKSSPVSVSGLEPDEWYTFKVSAKASAGGFNSDAVATNITRTASSVEWEPLDPGVALTKRYGHTASVVNGKMYIWGGYHLDGFGNPGYTDTGAVYDAAVGWETMSPAPGSGTLSRSAHTATVVGTNIVYWGGTGELGEPEIGLIYDTLLDSWIEMAPGGPSGRTGHAAATDGTYVYITGGESTSLVHNDGWKFLPDPNGGTWERFDSGVYNFEAAFHSLTWVTNTADLWTFGGKTNLPSENDFGYRVNSSGVITSSIDGVGQIGSVQRQSVFSTGTKVLFWGGCTSNCTIATSGGWEYDGGWTQMPTASAPRSTFFHASAWSDSLNLMAVQGGMMAAGMTIEDAGAYNVVTGTWRSYLTAALPNPQRRFHTMVFLGSKMCIWGGLDEQGASLNNGACLDLSGRAPTAPIAGGP